MAGETEAYPDNNVSIADDSDAEPDREHYISILSISLPHGVAIRENEGEALITIEDDDSKYQE